MIPGGSDRRAGPSPGPSGSPRPRVGDAECVAFLRWALPHLGLRWPGLRRVRRQVRRRLARRLGELGLPDLDAYGALLEASLDDHATSPPGREPRGEWRVLDALCRIPISRFRRDRGFWDALAARVLPELAQRARAAEGELRCWSAGCASGEEPFTLLLVWDNALDGRFRDVRLRVVATDADPHLLARARAATYPASSLRELPRAWREAAFAPADDHHRMHEAYPRRVEWRLQDIRRQSPPGSFHLILCRNLAFTYFAPEVQRVVLRRLTDVLEPGGALAVGAHESLPGLPGGPRLKPWPGARHVWRLATRDGNSAGGRS